MAEKKFFVDINLQGNALTNATIGNHDDLTKAGSFGFDGTRLKYSNGTTIQDVANLSDIAAVTGGMIFQGGYDPTTNTPAIAETSNQKGFFWVATAAGTFLGESVQVGDSIVAKIDNAVESIADWLILQGNVVIATDSVDGISRLATQAEANDGTEAGAVVITPATLQGKIDAQITPEISNKLPLAGGTMSGNLNMDGNTIGGASILGTLKLETDTLSSLDSGLIVLENDLDANNTTTIINLPAPTNGGDATNKTYVDGQVATALPLTGGTMDGTINMNGEELLGASISNSALTTDLDANSNKITNLLAPTAGGDATNKTYVDDADALKLDLSGGTMSGNIDMGMNEVNNLNAVRTDEVSNHAGTAGFTWDGGNLNLGGLSKITGLTGTPTLGTDATNKTYVDNNFLPKTGGTLNGELSLDYNNIVDLAAPTNAGDAANKEYVDTAASTAESNANSYTDTEIAATRYSANIQTTDWTVFGGDPANGYIATITHNLNCYYPVIQLNDDNTGYAVEMATQYNNLNETNIFSNFIPSGLIVATLIKAAV